MCGICGQISLNGGAGTDGSIVQAMMDSIHHRGPDDEGMYRGAGAILGHRRLSIIDLNRGRQPIANEDESVWIVFNGEIYNFQELRKDLLARGHVFRTETDTEVIVHGYEEYGEECIGKLRGMFAFAIWDERRRKLLLARDRVGIKPLYYSYNQQRLVFGSEIKAVVADPSVPREIDETAIDRFLAFKYLPGSKTLFRHVHKLEPGHLMTVVDGKVNIRQYWDLTFPATKSKATLEQSTHDLMGLLGATVRDHMISDVPVGVLLSGGVDSTALLSFVVQESPKPVETFTVGFASEACTDERPYARLAAETFGSRHHEMTITAGEFLEFLPKYVWHMEEPVCEPPAVALYYVSKLASQHVKVLLSGEGGDEAFAGYQNYRNFLWLERAKRLSGPLQGLAAAGLGVAGRLTGVGRATKYAGLMRTPFESYYYGRTWEPASALFALRNSPNGKPKTFPVKQDVELIHNLLAKVQGEGTLNQMLYVDSKTWLPDDLLVKADKITMANSVELRVPFLDHQVLEFAARLPADQKVRGFTTKFLLKKAFEGRIPQEIVNRPKTGFPVPYQAWFRGELQKPVADILRDRRTKERGYFDQSAVERLLAASAAGGNCGEDLFSLVTLELWHRQFVDGSSPGL